MSLLFKGRLQGAQSSQVSAFQKLKMFFINHLRQALLSLGELWRSPAATIMTVGVLGLSITLPSTLYTLVKNAESASTNWEQASEITLFLHTDTSEAAIEQLMTRLRIWSEISEVNYISSQQALEEFKSLSGFGEALSYLDSNPLPDVILVTPTSKFSRPTSAKILLDKLNKEREVELGKLDIKWLERLHAILDIAKDLLMVVSILLFLAVVLIIGNTIRLNILSKRDEILVMKLVGATDAFIRRPFMYTGFWFGLMGGLIAWFAVSILLWWMESGIAHLNALYQQDFDLTGLNFSALLVILLVSVGLGLAGSVISVNRHVKEIEPS